MNRHHNSKLTANSKKLRKSMTKEERHLWYDFLRELPVTIHRQKVIGYFIVDFYIAKYKIVIELDGSQHYEDKGIKKDQERDQYLKNEGISVLRYSNSDVKENFRSVCEDILNHTIYREP